MFLPCAGRVCDLLSDVSKFLNGKVRVLQIHALLHWLNFEEPLCDLICLKSRNDLVQLMHSEWWPCCQQGWLKAQRKHCKSVATRPSTSWGLFPTVSMEDASTCTACYLCGQEFGASDRVSWLPSTVELCVDALNRDVRWDLTRIGVETCSLK